MYLKHFGLKALPFQLTPDIGFLFMSEAHTRAKAYMDYTVWNREGFVVITGEIGCGKTTLIQKLLSELDENVVVAKIFQPQLNEILDHPELEQLSQRVKLRYHIPPLSAQEVTQYILFRLRTAGAADRPLFLLETFPVIYKYAGGTPRLINTLCDAALTCAYADNLPKITGKVVEAAASELQWPSYSERIGKRRQELAHSTVDSRLHDVLSEQSRSLATIAEQVGKFEN